MILWRVCVAIGWRIVTITLCSQGITDYQQKYKRKQVVYINKFHNCRPCQYSWYQLPSAFFLIQLWLYQ